MKGWHHEPYRHALSARGVKTVNPTTFDNAYKRINLSRGDCGSYVVALNRVLGGKGKYVGVIEEYEPDYISHVALEYEGKLYDWDGEVTEERLRDYGFDEEHPDQEIYILRDLDEEDVLRNTEYTRTPEEIEKEIRRLIEQVDEEEMS